MAPTGAVVLPVGEAGDVGAFAGVPGERWCDEAAVVGGEVDLRSAVADQAEDAVAPDLLLVDGAAKVTLELTAIVSAELDADLALALGWRTFGDLIDEAAGRHLAIENGAGAFEDFDAFELVGIELAGERVETHAVAEDPEGFGGEAADFEPVEAGLEAELVGLDSGSVAEGFVHGDDATGFHLAGINDGDGLGDFNEKGSGLGAGVGGEGDKAGVGGDVDDVSGGAGGKGDVDGLRMLGDGDGLEIVAKAGGEDGEVICAGVEVQRCGAIGCSLRIDDGVAAANFDSRSLDDGVGGILNKNGYRKEGIVRLNRAGGVGFNGRRGGVGGGKGKKEERSEAESRNSHVIQPFRARRGETVKDTVEPKPKFDSHRTALRRSQSGKLLAKKAVDRANF